MREDISETARIEALKADCTCAWHDISSYGHRDAKIRGTPDPNCPAHAESDAADRRQRATEMWWRSREQRVAPEPSGFWRRLWTGLLEIFGVRR